MRDNKQLTKIISACILGDGGVYIPPDRSKNAHFILGQTADHNDHVEQIKAYTDTLTSCRVYTRIPKKPEGAMTVKPITKLITRVHPFYTTLRNRWYPNGYKVLDPHCLKLLDWEMMAIWYMQDGCKYPLKNPKLKINSGIYLATLNFTYGDNMIMRHAIAEKLNMHFTVAKHISRGKHYWKLSLSQKCLEEFVEGVAPYIVDSFKYKLDLARRAP